MPSTSSIAAVRRDGDATVVALRGAINFTSVPAARQAIEYAIDADAPRRVVLNLAAVDYMDSAGVAMLVALRRKLLSAGATLVVAEPQPLVVEMFRVVKLHALMPIVETEAAALGREVGA